MLIHFNVSSVISDEGMGTTGLSQAISIEIFLNNTVSVLCFLVQIVM